MNRRRAIVAAIANETKPLEPTSWEDYGIRATCLESGGNSYIDTGYTIGYENPNVSYIESRMQLYEYEGSSSGGPEASILIGSGYYALGVYNELWEPISTNLVNQGETSLRYDLDIHTWAVLIQDSGIVTVQNYHVESERKISGDNSQIPYIPGNLTLFGALNEDTGEISGSKSRFYYTILQESGNSSPKGGILAYYFPIKLTKKPITDKAGRVHPIGSYIYYDVINNTVPAHYGNFTGKTTEFYETFGELGEYAVSSSNDAYVDTGIIPNTSIEQTFEFSHIINNVPTETFISGQRNSISDNFSLKITSLGAFQFNRGLIGYVSTLEPQLGYIYQVYQNIDSNMVSVFPGNDSFTYDVPNQLTSQSVRSIYIGSVNRPGGDSDIQSLGLAVLRFQLKMENKIVCDMIPVRMESPEVDISGNILYPDIKDDPDSIGINRYALFDTVTNTIPNIYGYFLGSTEKIMMTSLQTLSIDTTSGEDAFVKLKTLRIGEYREINSWSAYGERVEYITSPLNESTRYGSGYIMTTYKAVFGDEIIFEFSPNDVEGVTHLGAGARTNPTTLDNYLCAASSNFFVGYGSVSKMQDSTWKPVKDEKYKLYLSDSVRTINDIDVYVEPGPELLSTPVPFAIGTFNSITGPDPRYGLNKYYSFSAKSKIGKLKINLVPVKITKQPITDVSGRVHEIGSYVMWDTVTNTVPEHIGIFSGPTIITE